MQHVPSWESRVIVAATPGSGPNGYMCVIREPAMYTGWLTPGRSLTCTSLAEVSRADAGRARLRQQPRERGGQQAHHVHARARPCGEHELPHCPDPGHRVGLVERPGQAGAGEPVAAWGSSCVRRLIGMPIGMVPSWRRSAAW